MSANRKLQSEVQQVFKKIEEGNYIPTHRDNYIATVQLLPTYFLTQCLTHSFTHLLGILLFDDIWEKVYAAREQNLKEKYEGIPSITHSLN